jgi:hypothetical protein
MSETLTAALPPLYSRWIDEVLSGPVPEETAATCSNCAMCSKDGAPASGPGFFFNPETKCCTYIPELANFLVGRILSDDDPVFASGRVTVEARLRAGFAVTPLGMAMPPAFKHLYSTTAHKAFGINRDMRCPHYLADEGGRCGVWKHRSAICATWYCKHLRGAVGAKFWKSLQQLLLAVEQSLARWCVLELDVGVKALGVLFPTKTPPDPALQPASQPTSQPEGPALEVEVDRRAYASAWGNWMGREQEFYCEAARLVDALNWQDVIAIGGPELKIQEQLLREAHGKLQADELPPSLKAGKIHVFAIRQNTRRVVSYSAADPLDVPLNLMTTLPYFDGRPTLESLAAIEEKEGLKLSHKLVRKLADFEILVSGESPANK